MSSLSLLIFILINEGILRRHDALPPACQLAYDATVPQSKVWVAVYVDDKVVSYVCPRARRGQVDGAPDHALVRAGEKAYSEEPGVEAATEKAQRFASKFVVLGTAVDGDKGEAAAPEQRRVMACLILAAILKARRVDRKTLEQTLGILTPIF